MDWKPINDMDSPLSLTPDGGLPSGVSWSGSTLIASSAVAPAISWHVTGTAGAYIRVTVLAFHATNPSPGSTYWAAFFYDNVDAAIDLFANTEPPAPASVWSASDCVAFSPSPMVFTMDGYGFAREGIELFNYQSTLSDTDVTESWQFYIEAALPDAPVPCFWQDGVGVVEACTP
ncbi:MAG: hypothetical protein JSS23_00160 [Proteobacteria bacterium]|nr:hypothetical protein [Pseudomonadota bacterium]